MMKSNNSIIFAIFFEVMGETKYTSKTYKEVKIKSELQRKMRNSILNVWPKLSFISRYNQLYVLSAEL